MLHICAIIRWRRLDAGQQCSELMCVGDDPVNSICVSWSFAASRQAVYTVWQAARLHRSDIERVAKADPSTGRQGGETLKAVFSGSSSQSNWLALLAQQTHLVPPAQHRNILVDDLNKQVRAPPPRTIIKRPVIARPTAGAPDFVAPPFPVSFAWREERTIAGVGGGGRGCRRGRGERRAAALGVRV